MSRPAFFLLLGLHVIAACAPSSGQPPVPPRPVEDPPAPPLSGSREGASGSVAGTNVRFALEYDVVLRDGSAGLRLRVTGWTPGAPISLHVVGKEGEILEVVPLSDGATASASGASLLDVPYDLPGLYEGAWETVVAGPEDGIHRFTVDVPLAAGRQEDEFAGTPLVPAAQAATEVTLSLFGGRQLPEGEGFTLQVAGWAPEDRVLIYAFNAKRERVDFLGVGTTHPVAPDGTLSLSIPYDQAKLFPGEWLLVVEGKSGKHGHKLVIPD